MPNRKTHVTVGTLVGGFAALIASEGQSVANRSVEAVGGSFGAVLGSLLADILDPPLHPLHRSIAHGILPAGGSVTYLLSRVQDIQGMLRARDSDLRGKQAETDNHLLQIVYGILATCCRLGAGFIVGLAAGYASHLLLDSMTPAGLPVVW